MKCLRVSEAFGRALLIGLALVVTARSSFGATAPVSPGLPAGFQSQIVELYSKNRCDEIVRRTNQRNVYDLRPNIIAIVAYCDPKWAKAEDLFALAESLVPAGDLILVLHAKYRTRKNPASADLLWKKVLLVARNPAFLEMANEYFSGNYSSVDHPINLSSHTVFANLMVGAGQESNPRPRDFVYLNTHGSGAAYARAEITWRHWYPWGSLAVDTAASESRYFSESGFDDFNQSMKIPIALHVYSDKDVVFQPIGGYTFIGGQLYQNYYGIGVLGVVFKGSYRQSVQGLVYSDGIYNNNQNQPSSGSHYRFEYSWEFFPELRYISMLLGIEHVSTAVGTLYNGVSGLFPFSHTDVDAQFKYEQNFRHLTFGIAPQFAYRIDSESSIYPELNNGQIVAKRRHDWLVGVQPSVTVPLAPQVQLYAWYSYQKVISNIGSNDYVNRNQTDNVVGIALKTTLSTY